MKTIILHFKLWAVKVRIKYAFYSSIEKMLDSLKDEKTQEQIKDSIKQITDLLDSLSKQET